MPRIPGEKLSLYLNEIKANNDPDACWVWGRCVNEKGYGRTYFRGRCTYGHIASYITFVGEIPDGHELDHLCRNTSCVNPKHLEPVTHRVNMIRGYGPTGLNYRKSHCRRGHELAGDNIRVKDGHRYCRPCNAISQREWRSSNSDYWLAIQRQRYKGNAERINARRKELRDPAKDHARYVARRDRLKST